MKEASWRAACDEWMSNFVEECTGVSTPMYQLYNSYIENNPDNYMDIGQFGKVLRSWFPYRKRRRGKQGAQIYVYQDVVLKSMMTPRPQHIRDIPPDPPPTLCKSYNEGPAKSYNLWDRSLHGPLSVPSMMVGNKKVGPILVSIPEGACTASSTMKGVKDKPECMVPLPMSKPKRKYEDESDSKLSLTPKKMRVSNEENCQSSSHLRDDSASFQDVEIKEEIEVEEESCLSLDQCRSIVPSPQPLQSVVKQEENGTLPMPPSEHVAMEYKPTCTKRSPQTSYKYRMALARQWVDANLIDKKGVTTSATTVFEAYVCDNPDKPLPPNSLAVVIRGKFPTRRKRVEQDSTFGYYYQDLELVKHGGIPTTFLNPLETTVNRAPIKNQVSTGQPVIKNKKSKKNKTKKLLSSETIIMAQDSKPDITTESEGMQQITTEEGGGPTVITGNANRKLRTLSGKEEEKLSTTEGKKEEKQAIERESAKTNPVIFTDKDRGIPVAVANPPSESVFNYHGVPCVMIPFSHPSNIIPHVQDPTVLDTSKGKAVVSPITKLISSVSQQALTPSNEARKQSRIIPTRSHTAKNATRAPPVTSVKSNDLKNNMTASTHPSYRGFPGKIHIKSVASINVTDQFSFATKEKPESTKNFVGRENPILLSSSTEKEKQSLANFEEKEESAVHVSYVNKNFIEIKKEPVDENNDVTYQSLMDKAHGTNPYLEQLPDMNVLDYIKNEMAEDDEYVSVDVRTKPSQNITESFDSPEDAIKITQNNVVFMCESQLTDLDRNIAIEKISENMTGVTNCESKDVREKIVHGHDVQENAKNVTMVENRDEGYITGVQSQNVQGNSGSSNVSKHKSISAPADVENEVTKNKNPIARESVNTHAEMLKESTQLEGGVENLLPGQGISKVGQKVTPFRKTVRSWDEDIRSFVGDSGSGSRLEGSKSPKKRKKRKRKERNLYKPVNEWSLTKVKSSSKSPKNSKFTKNTQYEKTESLSENAETGVLSIDEGIPLSDRTFSKNNNHFEEDSKQTGEKVKRAVLNATFELLTKAGTMLTEVERAQKLEAALFDDKNPAVEYDTRRDKTYTNIKNDSLEDFPCIPSSALEDFKLCSQDQSTELLLHHQACPQLGCQKCCILRAAYVHITLLHHRCQVWRTFTRIVSKHSRACRIFGCSIIFCQFMKHELHLSGISVLSNHLLNDHTRLEAEFTKCHKAGTHGAALHCNHQESVSLPVPCLAQVGCQQRARSVEARGLKVMTDLLMPDRHIANDVTMPILNTLQFAAVHHDYHAKSKD